MKWINSLMLTRCWCMAGKALKGSLTKKMLKDVRSVQLKY